MLLVDKLLVKLGFWNTAILGSLFNGVHSAHAKLFVIRDVLLGGEVCKLVDFCGRGSALDNENVFSSGLVLGLIFHRRFKSRSENVLVQLGKLSAKRDAAVLAKGI